MQTNLKLCYARFKFVNHPVHSLLALGVSAPSSTPSYRTFPSAVIDAINTNVNDFQNEIQNGAEHESIELMTKTIDEQLQLQKRNNDVNHCLCSTAIVESHSLPSYDKRTATQHHSAEML